MEGKMIESLPEGILKNASIMLKVGEDEQYSRICACCICSPGIAGGAPHTATSRSGRMLSDRFIIIGEMEKGLV